MNFLNSLSVDQQQHLLASLRQLCRLFWGTDIGQSREMFMGRFFLSFSDIADSPLPDVTAALKDIDNFISGFSDPDALHGELESTYIRLFVSNRAGVAVPLYQSCYAYDGAPLMGASAVSMRRRLETLGLKTDGIAAGEPPDHLAIELECLYFLLEKGWTEDNAALIQEARSLASEELGAWIGAFEERLRQAPDPGLYAPAASLVATLARMIGRTE